MAPLEARATAPASSPETDFSPLVDPVAPHQSVAAAIAGPDDAHDMPFEGEDSDRLVGSLVHRLLQREGLTVSMSDESIAERLAKLVRVEESIAITDREALFRRAVAAYRAFSTHPDLRALYVSGAAFHEVPFSLRLRDRIVRGTIDCLVRGTDGSVTVVEFKTGRPRPEHRAQTDLYRLAAQALFPDHRVVTQLLYASDASRS